MMHGVRNVSRVVRQSWIVSHGSCTAVPRQLPTPVRFRPLPASGAPGTTAAALAGARYCRSMAVAGSESPAAARRRRTRQAVKLTAAGAGAAAVTAAATTGVLFGQARQARRIIPWPRRRRRAATASTARSTPGRAPHAGRARRLVRGRLRRAPPPARPRVRCWPPACPGGCAVRYGCAAWPWSAHLGPAAPQVEAALDVEPDLAVILIGANDVTHRDADQVAVRHLAEAVRALRAAGAEVVVGTCPDLGAIQPIQPPLRWLARRWSRQLAAAQTVAVVEAGGWTVSLGDLLGPRFAPEPKRMFAWDRFHPSAEGYAMAAAGAAADGAVARSVPTGEPRTAPARGEGVRSLPKAAQEAARHAGTEVSGAQVHGQERGAGRPVGPAAPPPDLLRCRRRRRRTRTTAPGDRRPVDGRRDVRPRRERHEPGLRRHEDGTTGPGRALTLIAGTVGGAAVLAAEALAGPGPPLRAAGSRPGAALDARRRPRRRRCGWCCSATPPRSASGSSRVERDRRRPARRAARRGRPTGSRRVRPVQCRRSSGSRSADLATQVARALLGTAPDVAVILIGANDATALRRPREAAAHLGAAVRRLRDAGVEVVVGTCPDLGAVRAIAAAAAADRRLARAADRPGADRRGAGGRRRGRSTSPRETGPVFRADAGTLCHDGFHPSGRRLPGLGARAAPGRRGGGRRPPLGADPRTDPRRRSAQVTRRLTLAHAD